MVMLTRHDSYALISWHYSYLFMAWLFKHHKKEIKIILENNKKMCFEKNYMLLSGV